MGSFIGWTTSAFTQSVDQGNVGNIEKRGNFVRVSGGSVGDVMGLGWQARANGDRAGSMALQFTRLALGQDSQMVDFEADTRGGVLGFTAIGNDGTSISYRPGEGGTGVLTITRNGKTITTKVNSDGSIEGITTGKLSEGIVAMFGQALAQAWARESAQAQKDADLLSQLTQEANRITEENALRNFYEKVKRLLGKRRTEVARESLQRIANAIQEYLDKNRAVTQGSQSGTTEIHAVQQGSSVSGGAHLGRNVHVGKVEKGAEKETRLTGSGSAGINVGVNYYAGENTQVQSQNTHYGKIERTTQKGERKTASKEEAKTNAERESTSQASSNSISEGLSYSVNYGSIQELMQAVSKTLQFSKERLESYKQSLQATDSAELRTALLPKVFNLLKQEEAQKLQNSGLSKEEIEAKAAMNALARLDDMIEKSPKELFKYLNSVSGLPDAEKLKEKVEEKTPQAETVGNPPPELRQQIENAENKLNSEYSLNAFVGNKKQADALAKKLTQLTGRKAEVIKMNKGYMVSVGGFQSEGLARGLAQGLGLKNYRVEMVQPQQQQLPAPAKR
ncbi:MAG: SPOR domain-containing protein [Thermocrinis sp.]|uniref:SPOR domain-containing protein n=1 Tax=Thermocrinis sp. TaxID=2024383 RepID=UPI003C12AFAD